MSELKKVKLDYLTEEEILDFYELFFGNILIKKKGFSYHSNLSKCLQKESLIQGILERLNDNEINLLKIISYNTHVPYRHLIEKLNIILNIPSAVINKSISNLIEKKYIFLRENKDLIVPDIYFNKKIKQIEFEEIENNNKKLSGKTTIDFNNCINYFISIELKSSNALILYKKDLDVIKSIFSKYSNFKEVDYNIIAYFYTTAFTDENNILIMDKIIEFFNLTPSNRILYFIKYTLPWFYSIISHIYQLKKSVMIDIEQFKGLWIYSFLLTPYNHSPYKINFLSTIKFLEKIGIIESTKDKIKIFYFEDENIEHKDELKLTSSFNLYINADSARSDFYFPALFAEFIKYNKVVEYEINEYSIKRSVFNGIEIDDIMEYLNKFKIKITKNVETTIKQWHDKYSSYYYTHGTLFFCKTPDKSKLIKTLIKKGAVKAFEIKKDEVFLIPEDNKEDFFNFLNKSDINYYEKKPKNILEKKNKSDINLSKIINIQ